MEKKEFRSICRRLRKAKKEYSCNSCYNLFCFVESGETEELNAEQRRIYQRLFSIAGKIQKGDMYWCEKIIKDGQIKTVRYLQIAHDLCIQLDCYRLNYFPF